MAEYLQPPAEVTDAVSARRYLSKEVNRLWLADAMNQVRAHLKSAGVNVREGYKKCIDSTGDLSKCMRDVAIQQGLSIKYRSAWGESVTTKK